MNYNELLYAGRYDELVNQALPLSQRSIGCEKDPERAEDIYRWNQDDEDRMWELLAK